MSTTLTTLDQFKTRHGWFAAAADKLVATNAIPSQFSDPEGVPLYPEFELLRKAKKNTAHVQAVPALEPASGLLKWLYGVRVRAALRGIERARKMERHFIARLRFHHQ